MNHNARKARLCCFDINKITSFFKRKSTFQASEESEDESVEVFSREIDTLSSEEEEELIFPRVIMKPLNEIEELIGLMLKSNLFSHWKFTRKRLRALAYAFEMRNIAPECYKLNSADFPFFLIEKGNIGYFEGDKKVSLGEGDTFGEDYLFSNKRPPNFFATSESLIWVLDKNAFSTLIHQIMQEECEALIPVIESIPIFSKLSKKEKLSLIYNSHTIEIDEGQVLFHKGDFAFFFYGVLSGNLEIFHEFEDMECEFQGSQGEISKNEIENGNDGGSDIFSTRISQSFMIREIIGLEECMKDEKRKYSIISKSKCELLAFDSSKILKLLQNNFGR